MDSSIRIATTASLILFGVPLAWGQEPQAPQPTPQHERLGYFVGTWNTVGEMKPGPMGPGGKVAFRDKCEWFEGRFAVVCRSEGKAPMGSMQSMGIMSYSPEEKAYTWYGVDNSGMTMASVPRGKVDGKTWTFDDESMMGGNMMKSRVTIREVSPTEYTFSMDLQQPDGKWAQLMETRSTKAK